MASAVADSATESDVLAEPKRSYLTIALAVAAAVIAFDQLTKYVALRSLTFGDPIGVFWTLEWQLSYNTGSAFSIGAGDGVGPFIGIIAVVIAIVVLAMSRQVGSSWIAALLGLVAGGAVGNVVDRVARVGNCGPKCDGFMGGGVIDFIDFNWWPIFNVADMCIVVGAIAIGLFGLRGDI